MAWIDLARTPPPWFHAVCAMVDIGSVLVPGNMGRILKLYQPDAPRAILERDFEEVRQSLDADLPSRSECIFLCPTFDDALAFAATGTPDMCQWYEVEPVEPVARIFAADLRWWPQPSSSTDNRNAAAHYWTAAPSETHRELLFTGKVRVTNALPPMKEIVLGMADSEVGRERLRKCGFNV